jgi:hypothetical protein
VTKVAVCAKHCGWLTAAADFEAMETT